MLDSIRLLLVPSCIGHYPIIIYDSTYVSTTCQICDSKVTIYNIVGLDTSEIDILVNTLFNNPIR